MKNILKLQYNNIRRKNQLKLYLHITQYKK